jgi:hypothetical protein
MDRPPRSTTSSLPPRYQAPPEVQAPPRYFNLLRPPLLHPATTSHPIAHRHHRGEGLPVCIFPP